MASTWDELSKEKTTHYEGCTVSMPWSEAGAILSALSELTDFLGKIDAGGGGQYARSLKEQVKSLRECIDVSETRHDFKTLCAIKRWRGGMGAAEFGLSQMDFEAFEAGEMVSAAAVKEVKAKLKEWYPGCKG